MLKNWRAVYEYKRGLVRGAGACFAIAPTEEAARQQIAEAMPGVTITQIREEQEDPLAVYERRPPVLSIVRGENLEAKQLEQETPKCGTCFGRGTMPGFAEGTFPCTECHRADALRLAVSLLEPR